MDSWDSAQNNQLYGIDLWGEGYFGVNESGSISVRPDKTGASVDLHEIVRALVGRGITVPVLVRFDGIVRDRVRRIHDAFTKAIEESSYSGRYTGVFPIKVNQQRHVVDTIRLAGKNSGLGLEVGSKPELCAVLAVHDTQNGLLLCNGYKDNEYIELALVARKLGQRSIIIVEQLSELTQTIEIAKKLGLEAEIGIRMKPVSKGSGRWETSGGDKAKFGLTAPEILTAIGQLREHGKLDWLKLLHFHAGSQITSIGAVQKVLREATRMYVEIAKLCPAMCFFDVGGGLAVDYDGSKTNFQSSMNYSLEEYARDVVYAIDEACKKENLRAPDIITESGRALTAHHSVLVFQVVDVSLTAEVIRELPPPPTSLEKLRELQEMYSALTVKNCLETLHDANALRENVIEGFNQGSVSLAERAYADEAYWHLVAKVRKEASEMRYIPEEIERLDEHVTDTYFCNFSVFQSLPDSWAIEQLFPILPIHRLKERPQRRAILADMSCDSDGKIDKFIDLKDVKPYLPLHTLKSGEPYYLGAFLVGAYQEILGDLHNLFGDTNAVHVDIDSAGAVKFTHVVEGDTIREALGYVQYDSPDLIERLRNTIEREMSAGRLTVEESAWIQKRYREALDGYTYLTHE
jgi:arginine decarboxylase